MATQVPNWDEVDWDEATWDLTSGSGFTLGSSLSGILGTDRLGESGTTVKIKIDGVFVDKPVLIKCGWPTEWGTWGVPAPGWSSSWGEWGTPQGSDFRDVSSITVF